MIYALTSCAANYLPKARVLFESLRKYHPEFVFAMVMSEDSIPVEVSDLRVDIVLNWQNLGFSENWVRSHTIVEVCTGIKAKSILYLMQQANCEAVLYFDPDIAVFSRLDDLLTVFDHSSILLTPHQTMPESIYEAVIDNEISSLQYGIYNLGFIGVKNDAIGRAFTEWWADRLDNFCYAALEKGLFVDQKWVDLVPAIFDGVSIIRSPRFNVATWNINTRKVEGSFTTGLMVDDLPLGFYHFTGFDNGAHRIMAAKYAGSNNVIKELIDWYSVETRQMTNVMTNTTHARLDWRKIWTHSKRMVMRPKYGFWVIRRVLVILLYKGPSRLRQYLVR